MTSVENKETVRLSFVEVSFEGEGLRSGQGIWLFYGWTAMTCEEIEFEFGVLCVPCIKK